MKLRNFLIVLFAVLMVFALASCKHEPKVDPTPAPEEDPWELYPYKDYTPTTNDVVVIEITEGCEKDYYNRDKLKLYWEEPVEAGDTVTLKYRSERGIYQWDVRDDSKKWVYETSKNNFTDPVLGAGGWYSFSYTFSDKDIDGNDLSSNTAFGIYFRGNFVEGDVFEIMDAKLNGQPLEITQENVISYAEVGETIKDHVWDIPRNYAILLATGKPGEVDKTPLVAKVAPGSTVEELSDILEEDGGYIVELFSDDAKTTPYNLSTKVLKDALVVYYNRTGVERTVKFDLNGGTAATPIADVKLLNGQSVAKPETVPTKTDMLFAEWCTDKEGKQPYDFSKPVKGDLTLYARYGVARTVTFDLNGAEGTIAAATVADGMPVSRPTPDPTNGKYALDDWYLAGVKYDFSTPVTADIELKAEWDNKTVVTLNLGYGTPVTFKAVVDIPLAADNENLKEYEVRDGYFFEGWYKESTFENKYDFTQNLTAPLQLYAKWSEGTIYRITSLGHTDSSGNKYDKFAIWWTGNVVKANDVITLSFRSTEPIKQYSIRKYDPSSYSKWFHEKAVSDKKEWPLFWSYYSEGEDGWTTVSYKFPEPTDKTQKANIGYGDDGCGFVIYFRNQAIVEGAFIELKAISINGVEVDELTDANLGSVSALSCVQQAIEKVDKNYEWTAHTVTFNTDGGTVIADASVNFGRPVEEPADPEKEGNVFVGWYADALFAEEFNFETPIIKDTTIYAKFGAKKVVTFDSKGGSAVDAANVASGEKVAKPEDPTKEGLVFSGWFTDEGLTAAYDFDTPVTTDLTLYAKWINAKKLTLNLNYEGAPEATVLDVEGGVALTAPKTPARAGWFFGGWYKEAKCTNAVDFAEGIAADTTIYAKWNAPTKSYKYTVKAGGETADRFQWIWDETSMNSLKKGDTLTFMVKSTAASGKAITNYRLRYHLPSETDMNQKYKSFPEAVDGWYTVTIVLDNDYPGTGLILGLYAASQASGIATGDILEIKAVAFNGIEIPVGALDGYSVAADLEVINL